MNNKANLVDFIGKMIDWLADKRQIKVKTKLSNVKPFS